MAKYKVTATFTQEFDAADFQAAHDFGSGFTKEIGEASNAALVSYSVEPVEAEQAPEAVSQAA